MLGSADEILQQSVLYGALTVVLLSPRVSQLLPQQQRKWLSYLRKPILSAVLMYLAYLPVATPRVNFYAMLEVGIHASKNDILQGYRNVSKKYHPDRVAASGLMPPLAGSSTPEEYFMDLKKAQEVLTHDIRKSFYDRFGDLKEVGEVDEKISIMAIFFVYSIAVFCVELQQRFVEDDDSLNFLPFVSELLPFEKILFFRALFPFVLVGSLCLAAWQFCDVPARHWAVLKALLSTNRVLTERTQELIRATSFLKTMGTPSVAALKAMGQQQQTLQSAAVRAKAAGVDIGSQQAASTLPSTAAPAPPYNPNLSELENFTARLTEEQREHFKRVIEEQYRRTEQEDKALEKQRARFDINWSQVLMWGGLFVAWLYYK
ncbi:uncharacterized protein LOC34621578 [Cyclospora cayetanensis]|uniref:Uncharacterized protein LOC34621578 n=1 Tax=Cyclospora cayetanensis TaxID=88456 RepID=A0A6P6RUH1_9EIME|nr:uncharacterized protein LOC34621578 [Cyclospora cayetanensis]